MKRYKLTTQFIVMVFFLVSIIEIVIFAILVTAVLNSNIELILISLFWFTIIFIIYYPLLTSKFIEFDRNNLYYKGLFNSNAKEVGLEKVSKINISIFGMYSKVKFEQNGKIKHITTMNNYITGVEHNKIDFIGVNKKLFNSKKNDVVYVLNKFIMEKKSEFNN